MQEALRSPLNRKGSQQEGSSRGVYRFFYTPENYKVYCDQAERNSINRGDSGFSGDPVMMEVIEATNTADDLSVMWNGRVGENELPPDFRNFTYKTVIEVIQGQRDIPSACEEMNKTWQVAMQSFNPVTDAK